MLAQLAPDHVPSVLAVEGERHWMLMADAGQTLRQVMRDEGNISRLAEMLPQFAHFQMQTIEHTSRLLSIGCPDWRLTKLPTLCEELLADTPTLLIGQPQGISAAEYAQLRQFTPQVEAMCEQLASYNIPQTLHHDDFHGGNILVQDHSYIFFDWSDSAITHPFCSMMIALRVAELVLKCDTPTLERLRDTYVQCWTAYEPLERLLEAFKLAHRLGILCRTLTWHRVISGIEPSAKWEFEDAVPYFLRMFFYNAEPDDIPK
jgi:hypothetical protein